MDVLKRALSWLVVGAIWLAPMLVYWAVGVIGQAFRRSLRRSSLGSVSARPQETRIAFGNARLAPSGLNWRCARVSEVIRAKRGGSTCPFSPGLCLG
jgi:hypothetical protein